MEATNIIPNFKKGNKAEASLSNYWPVNFTSFVSKVFKSIVWEVMIHWAFVQQQSIITMHGFLPRKFYIIFITQFLTAVDEWTELEL